MFLINRVLLLLLIMSVGACATRQPSNIGNVCAIFKEKPKWYKQAKKSSNRWGAPIYLPMAIMHQESSFKHNARPPQRYFLWVIPRGRASNAYGYAQALKSTWGQYQSEIGSRFRDRDNFASAYDFIQWYLQKTFEVNGIPKSDVYSHYLNYHEGQGGFSRGTHHSKQWLLNIAQKVDQRAKLYSTQLQGCVDELENRRSGWFG